MKRQDRGFIRGTAARSAAAAGLILLLGLILLQDSWMGAGFIGVGLAALAWAGAGLVLPWLGPRRHWRVLYHASTFGVAEAEALGRSLDTLARTTGSVLVLVWRREGGEITWAVEGPATSEAALTRILAHLLPDLVLDPTPPPPPLAVSSLYRWPLAQAGRGGEADPCDVTVLPATTVLTSDYEVRIHMGAGGGVVIVHGTPGATAAQARLRPLWRPLWRVIRRPGMFRIWRHYPLLESWPEAHPPAIRLPISAIPGTTRLDTHASLHLPLPSDYTCSPHELVLGRSTLDGRALHLAPAAWGAHFLVLATERRTRQAAVLAVLTQALAKGASVLYLDSTGEHASEIAAYPAMQGLGRPLRCDLDNPGGSVRLNLLAVPPDLPPSAPSTWTALGIALDAHVPALATYLRWLGVRPEGEGRLLLDWARVLLIRYHRERLAATPDSPRPAINPPSLLPDLPGLYSALTDPDRLPELLEIEQSHWMDRDPNQWMVAGYAHANGLTAGIRTVLADMQARLLEQTPAGRRLAAATLRTRLATTVRHPGLHHLWHQARVAPEMLWDTSPGPLLLARLPGHPENAREAGAARAYGAYLLACVRAIAAARQQQTRAGPPLLVILDDASAWRMDGLLRSALDALGSAGIAVLLSSATLPVGSPRWLEDLGTWWIGRLAPTESVPVQTALRKQGLSTDVPLGSLPAGMTICKTPTPNGPVVASVYPDPPLTHRNDL